jgi:hypothetical protein
MTNQTKRPACCGRIMLGFVGFSIAMYGWTLIMTVVPSRATRGSSSASTSTKPSAPIPTEPLAAELAAYASEIGACAYRPVRLALAQGRAAGRADDETPIRSTVRRG